MPFEYHPHPHIEARKVRPVAKTGFNDWIAAKISSTVGSMYFFWGLAAFIALWIIALGHFLNDPYPYGLMLLIVGGIFQALAMVAIMVAQDRQGKAADSRAESTYKDAEAILHECLQLQEHLRAQDEVLSGLIDSAKPVTPKAAPRTSPRATTIKPRKRA